MEKFGRDRHQMRVEPLLAWHPNRSESRDVRQRAGRSGGARWTRPRHVVVLVLVVLVGEPVPHETLAVQFVQRARRRRRRRRRRCRLDGIAVDRGRRVGRVPQRTAVRHVAAGDRDGCQDGAPGRPAARLLAPQRAPLPRPGRGGAPDLRRAGVVGQLRRRPGRRPRPAALRAPARCARPVGRAVLPQTQSRVTRVNPIHVTCSCSFAIAFETTHSIRPVVFFCSSSKSVSMILPWCNNRFKWLHIP